MNTIKLVKSMPIILILILAFGYPTTSFAAKEFPDVKKGSDHYESIHWLVENGIQGYPDGTFGKHDALTREQAAVMFTKVLNLKKPAASRVEEYFNDVTADDSYAREIAAIAQEGIFSGDGGQFNPHDNMTREQMATTLVNAYNFESGDPSAPINLENVTRDHKESVQTIADLKITSQLKNFRPREAVTRGHFATFLYKSDNVDIGDAPGVKKNYVSRSYNYNFSTALNKQMNLSTLPQTDSAGSWYDASKSLTQYYLNPENVERDSKDYYQFLLLSGSSKISTTDLNSNVLQGKGQLEGKAADFKKASNTHNVNEIYLVSHALLETGNGSSLLAKGVDVGLNKDGKPVRVTSSNRKRLHNIKKSYNFFGIGAVDSCALTCGSERAYKEGWFSPKAAIVGGAKFINNGYFKAGQDTLYKMRWNPAKPATHQYATDVGWAIKQTANIKKIYDLLEDVNGVVMNFEEPSFNKQPKAKARPTGADVFNVNTNHSVAGKTGTVNASSLNFRSGPTTKFNVISALPKGTKVSVIGVNKAWYNIKVGRQHGWVSGKYITMKGTKSVQNFDLASAGDQEKVTPEKEEIESKQANPNRVIASILTDDALAYEEANENSDIVLDDLSAKTKVEVLAERSGWFKVIVAGREGWMTTASLDVMNVKTVKADTKVLDAPNGELINELMENDTVIIVPDENLELTQDDDWYEVYYHDQKVWIHKEQLN